MKTEEDFSDVSKELSGVKAFIYGASDESDLNIRYERIKELLAWYAHMKRKSLKSGMKGYKRP